MFNLRRSSRKSKPVLVGPQIVVGHFPSKKMWEEHAVKVAAILVGRNKRKMILRENRVKSA